jgi:hypothetical protein
MTEAYIPVSGFPLSPVFFNRQYLPRLRQNLLHDAAMHIRQAELAALEAIGEAFVIDAEAMENRGLEVVDVHGILQGIETEIIGATESHTGLDAASGHPD